jgi:transcriptional regulator with XRE-family HTH domain
MITKNPILQQLGQRIRTLRQSAGYTQEEFAYKAGLDRSYYGAVERGERNLSVLNLLKIAEALDVDVGVLFDQE